MLTTETVFDAFRATSARSALPTVLDTAGIRELSPLVRRNAVFAARLSEARAAQGLKEIVDQLANDRLSTADAKSSLQGLMRSLGYTPTGGFPDTPPGQVPPAVAGSLQDLSSFRRIDLIIDTQREIAAGAGQVLRGSSPEALRDFPAWELVRGEQRRVPRDWPARFEQAGGTLTNDGGRIRMIALKGSPVWGELGSSGNFDDALDLDHPPFAFTSGMVFRSVSRRETRRLGIVGPDGESIEAFQASNPITLSGAQALPAPRISSEGIDPSLLAELREEFPDFETFSPPTARQRAQRSAAAARATRIARGESQ